jgi:EAL domain-containing protein (putative c-di-GMP-specific phosphodiesterase class I)
MGKLKNIMEGWVAYLANPDPEELVEAQRRANICVNCEACTYGSHLAVLPDFRIEQVQGMYCSKEKGGCGCPLSPAVRSRGHECPKGKWATNENNVVHQDQTN